LPSNNPTSLLEPSTAEPASFAMSANTLTINLPPQDKSYPIIIEPGALNTVDTFFKALFKPSQHRFLILTDKNVGPLYRARVQLALERSGFQIFELVLPAGETIKTLDTARYIYDKALEIGLTRQDGIIALGGGVIGDLAGYCAATFYRGLPLIQLPTTLLAQVDSAVGGKVAVNYQTVKNAIGTFYQPKLVISDPKTLSTLPEREIRAGLAEVVKYALIEKTCVGQELLFSYLRAHAQKLTPVYSDVIQACCAIKAAVVQQDETETTGIRQYLNFGHTFAHAFEAATGYDELLHGEAVAIGMIKAFQLAIRLGELPKKYLEPVLALYQQLELPTDLPRPLDPHYLLHLMHQDKKASQGRITLILPNEKLGQVKAFNTIGDDDILAVL